MRRADGERGVALLSVLLLVAVIAVIAGAALAKLRTTTLIGGNGIAQQQLRADAFAAEAIAVTRISDLIGRDRDKLTLAGDWSGRRFTVPVEGGIVSASVVDGGNCFNLNSLVVATAPGVYAAFTPARLQFARLIRLVAPNEPAPDAVAAAAADWIDSDDAPLPGGAEDAAYAAAPTPYRTAGTLMADVSELRAVHGVTPDLYARLAPWLCALPVARALPLNVETLAPEQAPLLAMLFPGTLPVETARRALLARPPQGFASVADFWAQPGLPPSAEVGGQVGIVTGWFRLSITAQRGAMTLDSRTLIDATRLPARAVSRQWGEL